MVQSVSLEDLKGCWYDFADKYKDDIQVRSLFNNKIQLRDGSTVVVSLNLTLQKELFGSIEKELLDYLRASTGHQGLTIELKSISQKSKKDILFEQYPDIVDFVKKLDLDI